MLITFLCCASLRNYSSNYLFYNMKLPPRGAGDEDAFRSFHFARKYEYRYGLALFFHPIIRGRAQQEGVV